MTKRHNEKNIVYIKRLQSIKIIAMLLLISLIIRLFYIQIFKHEFYIAQIKKQQQILIPLDNGRGIIYDKNLIPLTDREDKKFAIISPRLFNINKRNLELLSKISDEDKKKLITKIEKSKQFVEIPINNIEEIEREIINTPGLFIIEKKQRYEDKQILNHTIGYINQIDKSGMAGIEKSLDNILNANLVKNLALTVDGYNDILPGGITNVNNPLGRKNIRLTIDYYIQKISEEIIDKKNLKGTIIISDVKTGELLAIVSRPDYNPNQISKHINSNGDELYNKALQMSFPPGSIFKIILVAEALEKGVVNLDEIFYCKGYEDIGNISIKCSSCSQDEINVISFKEAFAKSCNSTFIQLGKNLGSENIINMAKKLSFGEVIDIGLPGEIKGRLPEGDELLGPAIGNISIGQGILSVTPLQVNQMTQIIANNGKKVPLTLFKGILIDEYIVEEFKTKDSEQILSKEKNKKIQELMESVMLDGTGKNIGELSNTVAGKTGTAQATDKGRKVLHAWFTGYYPIQEPKYSITILIQDGGVSSTVAVPVLKEILENMIANGY
ncbi:MAG: penicillin-binding protein 2 [Clostridiales bacterium]|nr:penicillin-binding protein 2 [Clostridiales bacterium]